MTPWTDPGNPLKWLENQLTSPTIDFDLQYEKVRHINQTFVDQKSTTWYVMSCKIELLMNEFQLTVTSNVLR